MNNGAKLYCVVHDPQGSLETQIMKVLHGHKVGKVPREVII